MTIDEAIAHEREVAIEQSSIATELLIGGCDASKYIECKEEHEQLAEWLEELKIYQQHKIICNKSYNAGYNKAIDDFAKLVEIWCWKHEQYNQDDLNKLMNIAEQLKAGGENGKKKYIELS